MARDTIFIGHATPDDNEFTLWLQAKLQNEGYLCECDLSLLVGGESDYWKTLQDFLTQRCSKYILVISKHTFTKQGVIDEWEYCRSIERQHGLQDFILPVKIDDTPYNDRIGLNVRNVFPFDPYWDTGLKRLLKKLSKDNVPNTGSTPFSLKDWLENQYTNWSGIDTEKRDQFYSNWLSISTLPKKIYFFQFDNDTQAETVFNTNSDAYPLVRHGNYLVSFRPSLQYFLAEQQFDVSPRNIFDKRTEDAFQTYESDEFPQYHDLRRLLVRLLKISLEKHLVDNGLHSFSLANDKKCFYFGFNEENRAKGKFFVLGKSKHIGVTGNYYTDFWHYAISLHPLLHPEVCYSLRSHIIFTSDGKTGWTDKKKMHRARRDKGKRMYNKAWRDQLLAFLACLQNTETQTISIEIAPEQKLELPSTPIIFDAAFSYQEPTDESRLEALNSYHEEEDDDYDDSDNEAVKEEEEL